MFFALPSVRMELNPLRSMLRSRMNKLRAES
jgi:hypothetical protein